MEMDKDNRREKEGERERGRQPEKLPKLKKFAQAEDGNLRSHVKMPSCAFRLEKLEEMRVAQVLHN